MMKDPSLLEMKLTEREMRVLEEEEEDVAEEASEVVEDLEDHSEEGVISAVDSEDEEDLEEEVDSVEEVVEDSVVVLVVRAARNHLGLEKHHKPNFFTRHHSPAVIGKLFSTPAVSTFSIRKQSLFSFEHQKYCFQFLYWASSRDLHFQILRSLIDTTQNKSCLKTNSHVQLTSEVHRNLAC